MADFENQIILITGGETGIGRATVELLAAAGARVVIGGILEEEGASTTDAVAQSGGLAEFHKLDVRFSDQVNALVDATVEKYGRIDGLVSNAAIFDGFAKCLDTSDALWDQIVDVNLRGTFFVCRAVLRHMVAAQRGRIVNVSSVGGLVGLADGASYTASKHGVIGFTKHIGCDYAKDGIIANVVCPGAIDTNVRSNSMRLLGENAPPMAGVGADAEWLSRTVPQQRKGTALEIAYMIMFLLSDKATYMTGQNFVVDGGWTAK